MPNPSYEIKGGKAKGGPQGVPNTNPARVVPKGSLRPGSIDVPFKRLAYAMKKGNMDPSFVLSLFLGVSGIGGGAFAYISKRFDSMDTRLDGIETTLHKDFVRKLEQQVQRIDEKLDRILLNGRHLSS
jgi:hypothetical protein